MVGSLGELSAAVRGKDSLRLAWIKPYVEHASVSDADELRNHQLCHAREIENLHLDGVRVYEGVLAVLENPHLGFYLVARGPKQEGSSEHVILGSLLITREWSDWRAHFVWWVQSVFVKPEFRGVGVFSRMYEHVERLAQEQGAAGIRLYVERNNLKAQNIYGRLGLDSSHYILFEKLFESQSKLRVLGTGQ